MLYVVVNLTHKSLALLDNMMILWAPISLFAFIFFIGLMQKMCWTPNKKPCMMMPPSPPGLPIIGNFHQLGGLPHRSLQALADRYGPLMLLKLGSAPTLIVTSKEVAEEVMKAHDIAFASRPSSTMADILMYGSRDIAAAPYGEYWRQMRRISVLHLLNFKRVQSYSHIRVEEVSTMIHKIRTATQGRVNLSELLITLTNNIICRVALGRKYSNEEEESKKYQKLLLEFMSLIGAFPVGDYIPWLGWVDKLYGLHRRGKRVALEFDNFIEKVLDDHLQPLDEAKAEEDKDLVDILLSLDKDGSVGMSLERDSIKAIILDMFAGGTDTTFTSLEWTIAELIRHPTVLQKVQKEIRKKVGTKTSIEDEDMNQMVYLKAVIKESLRLHPPVPLLAPREAMESSKLYGYEVPAKTRVIINAWAIGRNPKYWNKPNEFCPERFMDSPLDFKGQDFELLPFGAGRRGCPGILFATAVIELALVNLLYHFDWEMPDGLKGEEMDMTEVAGIAVHKKSNLLLVGITPHPSQVSY